MRVAIGLACFAAVPFVLWIGVRVYRNPEFSFWKHPILFEPFARVRWLGFIATLVATLVVAGVMVLATE